MRIKKKNKYAQIQGRVLLKMLYVYVCMYATTNHPFKSFLSIHSLRDHDWIETHLQLTALIQLHCELFPYRLAIFRSLTESYFPWLVSLTSSTFKRA